MRTPIWDWVISRAGAAFLFVPINVMGFYFVPKEQTNNATGLINLARNVGGSMGISFVTTWLDRRAQFHQQVLAAHVQPGSLAYQQTMHAITSTLTSHGLSAGPANMQAQGMIYGQLQRQAQMLSFVDNFWLMGVVCLAVIPMMFLMKKIRPRKGGGGPVH
jgi:DHA2 family multidrug resistance protein